MKKLVIISMIFLAALGANANGRAFWKAMTHLNKRIEYRCCGRNAAIGVAMTYKNHNMGNYYYNNGTLYAPQSSASGIYNTNYENKPLQNTTPVVPVTNTVSNDDGFPMLAYVLVGMIVLLFSIMVIMYFWDGKQKPVKDSSYVFNYPMQRHIELANGGGVMIL